jgi:hypothetical protein
MRNAARDNISIVKFYIKAVKYDEMQQKRICAAFVIFQFSSQFSNQFIEEYSFCESFCRLFKKVLFMNNVTGDCYQEIRHLHLTRLRSQNFFFNKLIPYRKNICFTRVQKSPY